MRYQNFVSKICHESVWPQKQEIKQKKTLEGKNQREGNSPLEIHLQIFDLGFYIPPSVADLSRKISESNLRLGDSFLGGSFQKKNKKRIPSRELTYPTWGKGNSSSKVIFDGIC